MAAERAPVPEWLDARLVERALAAGDETGDEAGAGVAEMHVNHANAVGDHYSSEMFRVTALLVGGGQRSLLVKCLPARERVRRFVAESQVFKVEGEMFAWVVPRMSARLQAATLSATRRSFPPLVARCLLRESNQERPVIVFEDLSVRGFRLADRRRGLGLRHSLLAVRALAHFHAASRALLETPGELGALLRFPNPFRSIRGAFEKVITARFRLLAAEVARWEGFGHFSRKISDLADVAFDKFDELNTFDPDAFHVLLHGDFWVNNMLFHYDGGRPDAVRFCDLQISHLGPPAIDLIYILYSSVSEDVSERHSELLLRAYHAELSDTLQLLGCERRLRWRELRAQLQACGVYATLTCFGILPLVIADCAGAMDPEGGASARLFQSPALARWVRRLLPQFERDGWLAA